MVRSRHRQAERRLGAAAVHGGRPGAGGGRTRQQQLWLRRVADSQQGVKQLLGVGHPAQLEGVGHRGGACRGGRVQGWVGGGVGGQVTGSPPRTPGGCSLRRLQARAQPQARASRQRGVSGAGPAGAGAAMGGAAGGAPMGSAEVGARGPPPTRNTCSSSNRAVWLAGLSS